MFKNYLELLRVRWWVKNLFIFLPAFFGGVLNDKSPLQLIIAFFSFSLFTSFIYVINDIQDVHSDRHHPRKKNRPIANHSTRTGAALQIAFGCLLVGMALSFFLPVHFLWLAGLYVIINILYSVALKKMSIVNLFIPVSGYIIRICIGSLIFGIGISSYIMISVFLIALLIAILNRREDLLIFAGNPAEINRSIRGYTLEFLNLILAVVTAAFIISYIQFAIYSDDMLRFNLVIAYTNILIMAIGLTRYLQLVIVQHKPAEPADLMFKDGWLLLIIAAWVAFFVYIIYLR